MFRTVFFNQNQLTVHVALLRRGPGSTLPGVQSFPVNGNVVGPRASGVYKLQGQDLVPSDTAIAQRAAIARERESDRYPCGRRPGSHLHPLVFD